MSSNWRARGRRHCEHRRARRRVDARERLDAEREDARAALVVGSPGAHRERLAVVAHHRPVAEEVARRVALERAQRQLGPVAARLVPVVEVHLARGRRRRGRRGRRRHRGERVDPRTVCVMSQHGHGLSSISRDPHGLRTHIVPLFVWIGGSELHGTVVIVDVQILSPWEV